MDCDRNSSFVLMVHKYVNRVGSNDDINNNVLFYVHLVSFST